MGRAELVPVAQWTPPIPADRLRLWTCDLDPSGELAVQVLDEQTGDFVLQRVDLATGAELDGDPVLDSVEWDTSVDPPPGWRQVSAKADDRGVVMWARLHEDDAPSAERLLTEEAGAWSVVDTCFTEDECLFAAEGTVYRGTLRDGAVAWDALARP